MRAKNLEARYQEKGKLCNQIVKAFDDKPPRVEVSDTKAQVDPRWSHDSIGVSM